MHYEEKVINGVLCSRSTPDGDWVPFTLEGLTLAFIAERGRAKDLERSMTKLLEKLSAIKEILP